MDESESEATMNFKDFCGSQEFDLIKQNSLKNLSLTHFAPTATRLKSTHLHSASATNTTTNSNKFFMSNAELVPPAAAAAFSFCSSSSSSLISMTNPSNNDLSSSSPSEVVKNVISDYRLTLSDLIELNLVDMASGLLINPVSGARLSIADAIDLDLLNTDVKEIANTFYLNSSGSSSLRYLSLFIVLKHLRTFNLSSIQSKYTYSKKIRYSKLVRRFKYI